MPHIAVCVQGAAPGALDGYLDRILPVMEADLFGDIAEAKEADVFAAKYRSVAVRHTCIHLSYHVVVMDLTGIRCNCPTAV